MCLCNAGAAHAAQESSCCFFLVTKRAQMCREPGCWGCSSALELMSYARCLPPSSPSCVHVFQRTITSVFYKVHCFMRGEEAPALPPPALPQAPVKSARLWFLPPARAGLLAVKFPRACPVITPLQLLISTSTQRWPSRLRAVLRPLWVGEGMLPSPGGLGFAQQRGLKGLGQGKRGSGCTPLLQLETAVLLPGLAAESS